MSGKSTGEILLWLVCRGLKFLFSSHISLYETGLKYGMNTDISSINLLLWSNSMGWIFLCLSDNFSLWQLVEIWDEYRNLQSSFQRYSILRDISREEVCVTYC